MTKENYKGSKAKVDALVKKLIKDNMFDPNEEEHWLIDEYDKFNYHAKECLQVFEKYYVAVWDDLKKRRRMDIEIFEEHLEHPNYYLLELLVYDFIKKTVFSITRRTYTYKLQSNCGAKFLKTIKFN